MWITNERSTALNLSKFCVIHLENKRYVKASLEDADGTEYLIKELDNEEDAKKFIADLVEKLNAEKKNKERD